MENKKERKHKIKTVSLKPYVYENPSISAVTIKIIILLLIQVAMLLITKSYSAVIVIFAATLGAFISSIIHFFFTKRQNFLSLTAIIQGMIIGMLLPENYPPLTVFFITLTTLLVFKYIFEDSENFWINIISVSVLIAFFIGRKFFPGFQITPDLLGTKNPSVALINNGIFPVYDFDVSLSERLNTSLFASLKVTLPQGILSMLWDTHSIIPAFRFNLLTIIASIVLFSDNSFSMLIPTVFLVVYGILIRLFFPMMAGGEFCQGDIGLALLTSGTLFVDVFMLQWFGTHPMTIVGKLVYALMAGVFAFFIAGCGTSSIGMVYVIILCNILNLLIRQLEEKYMDKIINKIAMTGTTVEVQDAGNNK